MGKRIDDSETAELFNFYLDKNTKMYFLIALAENNCQGQAAAAIRTMINLYINDSNVRRLVHSKIDNNIVYRKSGKPSKL